MPFITLASPTDTVVFMGDDPYATGFTYRNDTLTSWYKFAGADAPTEKRSNAHGAFGYDRLYANAGGITITGSFWGMSAREAAVARNRLTGLFADGLPVTMTVSDELGVFSRQLNVIEADVPYLPYPNFDFTIETTVPDPRRYAPATTMTTGAPSPSSGLVWPLGSTATYWNWGTPGASGQLVFTNTGNASTAPSFRAYGAGYTNGFRVTEVETARELTYAQPLTAADTVYLNGRYRTVSVNNGGNFTQRLSKRQWFTVPPKATRTYQFTPLGGYTGTPQLDLVASAANL